jgi:hypothetical protein
MAIRQEVLERILLAKAFLDRIRFAPAADPDNRALATSIVSAHDAAELVLAAVADHLNARLPGNKYYLMDYFEPIKEGKHPGRDVHGKEYCRQLNQVRNDIKHLGILPNARQWGGVGEKLYTIVSAWCSEYLGATLADLDLSDLLKDPTVRNCVIAAKKAMSNRAFKDVLIHVAEGMHYLFKDHPALLNVIVGMPRAEDAIKLTGFGVHANDFLTLQQFLPNVAVRSRKIECNWNQGEFGHPGNWRKESADFCLRTFLDLALKIQDAEERPTPIPFGFVYSHKITALFDGVKVWSVPWEVILRPSGTQSTQVSLEQNRNVWKTLNRGQSFVAHLQSPDPIQETLPGYVGSKEFVLDVGFMQFVVVTKKDVKLTCVPNAGASQIIPTVTLPEIDWEPRNPRSKNPFLGVKRRKKFPQHRSP